MQKKKSLPHLKDLNANTGQSMSGSTSDWVKKTFLVPEKFLPVVFEPTYDDIDLTEWSQMNRELINRHLLQNGGILFRGFRMRTSRDFEAFSQSFSQNLLPYTFRSTPRKVEHGHIYTSTEYPADQSIPYHNENSYTLSWPLKIWFYCVQPARQGGETPIADSRSVYQKIPLRIREKFQQKGVRYVRNYLEGVDISWQEVFQTEDKKEVTAYCHAHNIGFTWLHDHHLRTWQICQAIAQHPQTQETVWFNQAHLFHISSLPADVSASLLAAYGEEGLPRNAYYGDGTAIEQSFLDEIRGVYQQEGILFTWQTGDILMLDNMLVAHGRSPYTGPRKILVGMAEAYSD